MFSSFSYPYGGIIRVRFYGCNLSLNKRSSTPTSPFGWISVGKINNNMLNRKIKRTFFHYFFELADMSCNIIRKKMIRMLAIMVLQHVILTVEVD